MSHMSRDIRVTVILLSPETPAIGRGLVVCCASSPGGLDAVGREDLAGVERDDRDLLLVDESQDAPAGMGGADLEVVEATSPAQGHGPLAVGDVVAEAEVAGGAGPSGDRLGSRPIRLARCPAADRPVGPLLVVGETKGVELGLELGQGVWGCPGAPFFWRMPR